MVKLHCENGKNTGYIQLGHFELHHLSDIGK